MNKLNKYCSLAVIAALAGGAFTSCDDSKSNGDFEKYPGEVGGDIYFPANAPTQYDLETAGGEFSVIIERNIADETVTVPVSVKSLDEKEVTGVFTFPESVTFEANEKTAAFTVKYVSFEDSGMDYDIPVDYLLEIPEEYLSPFASGSNNLAISIEYPSPWTTLGVAQYYDQAWGVRDSEDDWFGPVEVTLQQNDLDKNLFRIDNPYLAWGVADPKDKFQFWLLKEGDYYYNVEITEPNLVAFDQLKIDFDPEYDSDIYLVYPGDFTNANINILSHCYVAEYQPNGLPAVIKLSSWYYMFGKGGYDLSTDEAITIVFPGAELSDTSVSVDYEGVLTNGSNTSILADVTVGADLDSVKVGVASGTNEAAIVEAIDNGTISSVEIKESTSLKLAFSSQNPTGRYSVVAVGYVDGKAVSSAIATFTYTQPGSSNADNNGWTSLGYIDYTEAYMCSIFATGIVTYPVEIQESEEYEGFYRLVNPYGEAYPYNEPGFWNESINSYLYIDTFNPDCVYIEQSEQTLNWPFRDTDGQIKETGELVCYSIAGLYLYQGMTYDQVIAEGYNGTLVDGVITFPPFALIAYLPGVDSQYYIQTNYVVDEYATDPNNPFVMTPTGEIYTPFYLDLNAISSTPAGKASLKKAAERREMAKTKPLTPTRALKEFKAPAKKSSAKKAVKQPLKAKTVAPTKATMIAPR